MPYHLDGAWLPWTETWAPWLHDVLRASVVPALPGLAFATILFWGHALPGFSVDCFLDKSCIHQTDLALKKQAIDSLDIFLRFSERMLVLYSPEYLSRLWCIYELATFIKLHPDGPSRIDFVPIWRHKFILSMNVYLAFVFSVMPLFMTGPLFELLSARFGGYLGYLIVLVGAAGPAFISGTVLIYRQVSDHTRMLRQLKKFRLADAECVLASDIAFVHGLIDVTWSSSREAADGKQRFEHFVRAELPQRLKAVEGGGVGSRSRLPYYQVVIMFLPLFSICLMLGLVCDPLMFELWGYASSGSPALVSWDLRWILYGLELWLLANPIATIPVQRVIARLIDAGWGSFVCVSIGFLVYVLTLVPMIGIIVACVVYRPADQMIESVGLELQGGVLALLTIWCYWIRAPAASPARPTDSGYGAPRSLA